MKISLVYPIGLLSNPKSQKQQNKVNNFNALQQDVFQFSPNKNLSFGAIKSTLNRTLVRLTKEKIKFSATELEEAAKDIPIFEGLNGDKLQTIFSDDLSSILLNRGCPNRCSHCFIRAVPANPNMMSAIKWEDFIELCDGIELMQKRLGRPLLQSDEIFPFLDSEPIELRSLDKDLKPHNIAEAAKQFKEKTGKSFLLISAGWSYKNKWVQQAGEDLTTELLHDPSILSRLNISIHPFHGIMEKSVQLKKQALNLPEGSQEAKQLLAKSQELETLYVDRMANVLLTFKPLFQDSKFKDKIGIILQYHADISERQFYNTDYLMERIITKIDDASFQSTLRKAICERRPISEFGRKNNVVYMPFQNSFSQQDLAKRWKGIDINGGLFHRDDFEPGFVRVEGISLNYLTKGKKVHGDDLHPVLPITEMLQ